MREYDLYLFDFDNTLYDTSAGIYRILEEVLPVIGVEYRREEFTRYLGMSMDDIFDTYSKRPDAYDEYRSRFYDAVATNSYRESEPFPETPHVLRALKERGKHIGIVSGKMRYKIVDLLEDQGLGDIPETIVGWDDTDAHKPDPEPVALAFSRFDVPRDRTLFVGDSYNDAGAADAFGVDCAIVKRPDGFMVEDLPCRYEIPSLDDLLVWDERSQHPLGRQPHQEVPGLAYARLGGRCE